MLFEILMLGPVYIMAKIDKKIEQTCSKIVYSLTDLKTIQNQFKWGKSPPFFPQELKDN